MAVLVTGCGQTTDTATETKADSSSETTKEQPTKAEEPAKKEEPTKAPEPAKEEPTKAPEPTKEPEPEPTKAPEPQSVTVTDSAGREVTVTLPVERVAILDRGSAEAIAMLGVLDKIVGNHEALTDHPMYPELKGIPAVATYSETSWETVAEVEPQIVFSSIRSHGVVTEQELLDGLGIVDVKVSFRRPSLIKDEFRLLGKLFGKEERAEEIVAMYEEFEQLVAERLENVPEDERMTMFLEYHAGDFKTAGPETRFYDQMVLAGAIPITSGIDQEKQVSPEFVAEHNPQVILREVTSRALGYKWDDTSGAEEVVEELRSRPGLEQTDAIVNNKIFLLPTDIYSQPRFPIGILAIAKYLYPEAFEDIDPDALHKEWVAEFFPNFEFKGVYTYAAE